MTMYGWRGRVGHLAPSRGDTFVHEFYQVAPEGVMLLNSTGSIRDLDRRDIERQLTRLEEGARDLADAGADIVVLGGSPLFTLRGWGSERAISEQVTSAAGVPCVAGVQLMVEGLRALGVRRPAIATPYPPEFDERLAAYLTQAGFEVQSVVGMGIRHNAEIGALPEETSYRQGRRAATQSPVADGILMPCNRWPTLARLALLEADSGLPAVSSAAAVLWGALRFLGLRDRIDGWGRLLASLRG
jgi:maleate isomerase